MQMPRTHPRQPSSSPHRLARQRRLGERIKWEGVFVRSPIFYSDARMQVTVTRDAAGAARTALGPGKLRSAARVDQKRTRARRKRQHLCDCKCSV